MKNEELRVKKEEGKGKRVEGRRQSVKGSGEYFLAEFSGGLRSWIRVFTTKPKPYYSYVLLDILTAMADDLKHFWVVCLPVNGDMQRTKDRLTMVGRQGKDYVLSNCVSNLASNWMRRISRFQLRLSKNPHLPK